MGPSGLRAAVLAVGGLLLMHAGPQAQAATPTITAYQLTTGATITSAAPGTQLVIKGANLGLIGTNLGSSGTVTFNSISAGTSSWTAAAITVTVPTAVTYPSTGPVVVATGGQTATGPAFTINAVLPLFC